jgi:hypothetical protein
MKISVITVSLDSADTIEPCIRSVIAQKQADIEHISVDGGSADGTLDIIENYRDHFAARLSQKDGGVYQAMNRGLALAGGGWSDSSIATTSMPRTTSWPAWSRRWRRKTSIPATETWFTWIPAIPAGRSATGRPVPTAPKNSRRDGCPPSRLFCPPGGL